MSDAINPTHYRGVTIDGVEVQCIDMIELLDLGFHLGNALKYAWRLGRKHDRIDEEIDKCLWYLNRWRGCGHEQRDLQVSKFMLSGHEHTAEDRRAAFLRTEISGYLRTMCTAWRARDLTDTVELNWMTASIPWMKQLIELLGIELEIVAYVKRG
jgi:hypothetical protein